MVFDDGPDRLPPRPRDAMQAGRELRESDYVQDDTSGSERRPLSEVFHLNYFIKRLDIRDKSSNGALSGMYRTGTGPPIRIFIQPREEVRRGHRIRGRVTELKDRCAIASADEILGDYLQYTVGNKVDVAPTAVNPYQEVGFASHPDYDGGCKGILVLVDEEAPSEDGPISVRITGYRELEDSDFYLLNLDPDADKYLFTGRLWVTRQERPNRRCTRSGGLW